MKHEFIIINHQDDIFKQFIFIEYITIAWSGAVPLI